jgi:hypothetical protein
MTAFDRFAQEWSLVFCPDARQNNDIEKDDDAKISHAALVWSSRFKLGASPARGQIRDPLPAPEDAR